MNITILQKNALTSLFIIIGEDDGQIILPAYSLPIPSIFCNMPIVHCISVIKLYFSFVKNVF